MVNSNKHGYYPKKSKYSNQKPVTLTSNRNYNTIIETIKYCINNNKTMIWQDDPYYLADIIGFNNLNLSNRDKNKLRNLTAIKFKGYFWIARKEDF